MIKFRNSIRTIAMAILLLPGLSSCIREDMVCEGGAIVVQRVGEGENVVTRGTVISSANELKGQKFGLFASLTPISSVAAAYFNTYATVNDNLTATISPGQFWPGAQGGSMKFFSWYPYGVANAPAASFTDPEQMVLGYTANADAAGHVDVMAAVSEPQWGTGVNIHFYHTLTKVTFTFKKIAPAPDDLAVEKIEFQGIGTSGTLTVPDIPTTVTVNNKPAFVWTGITTGNTTSTFTATTVTEDPALIGDTFLMLPTETFPADTKIVITTNYGERVFLFKDIVISKPHSWQSGEYINYNITISNEMYEISATPLEEWGDNPVNVIFDGQYYLKLSQNSVRLAANGATVNIIAETNYDADPNTGYPVGAVLETTNIASWPTVSMGSPTVSGDVRTYNVEVKIPNLTGEAATYKRETRFYIKAGNLKHGILLQQWGGTGIWLTSSEGEDGSDPGIGLTKRRKITFTSGSPGNWTWEITGVSDPNSILLNGVTMKGASGGNGDVVYFYFNADAKKDLTATLTLSNTNGDNPEVTVTLTVPQW